MIFIKNSRDVIIYLLLKGVNYMAKEITIKFSEKEYARIKQLCKWLGTTPEKYIRRVINLHALHS